MRYSLILAAILMAAGCGPAKVMVPDTAPPMQPPPESAMRPCPNAEREGRGTGVLPDVEDGTRGEIIQAATAGAEYWRICDERHRTLREHIEAYLEQQRAAVEGEGE